MKNTENMKKAFPLIAFGSVATFVVFLYMLAWFRIDLPFVGKNNMLEYGVALFVFAVVFILLYVYSMFTSGCGELIQRIWKGEMGKRTYYSIFVFLVAVISGFLLHRRMYAELSSPGVGSWQNTLHAVPEWLALLCCVFAGGCALHFAFSRKDIPAELVWYCYIPLVLLSFAHALTLNTFNDDLFHTTAYMESILNVYHLTPYTEATTGVYGHYGLFFAPLLRLLPNHIVVLSCLIAMVSMIAGVLCIYIIHNITSLNWVRVLGSCSCFLYAAMRKSSYWQAQPHRVIFSLIIIAYVLYLTKREKWGRKQIIFGFLICGLAVLWNTETGLFSAVAYAMTLIIRDLQENLWYSRKMLKKYAYYMLGVCFSLALAIAIVNLYNFICGYRTIEIKSFFFPLGTKSYMVDILSYNMKADNTAWVYVLILFGSVLMISLYKTRLFQSVMTEGQVRRLGNAPIMTCTSVVGLLNFSYYANRAVYYNLDIILQIACIAIVLLIEEYHFHTEKAIEKKRTLAYCWKKAVWVVSVMVLSVLSMQTVWFLPKTIELKADKLCYYVAPFDRVCKELTWFVPSNTFAFGSSISLLYYHLGWDTIGHYRDMPDLTVGRSEAIDEIVKDALEHDAFVVTFGVREEREIEGRKEKRILDKILQEDNRYILSYETLISGYPVQYYTRDPALDFAKPLREEQ